MDQRLAELERDLRLENSEDPMRLLRYYAAYHRTAPLVKPHFVPIKVGNLAKSKIHALHTSFKTYCGQRVTALHLLSQANHKGSMSDIPTTTLFMAFNRTAPLVKTPDMCKHCSRNFGHITRRANRRLGGIDYSSSRSIDAIIRNQQQGKLWEDDIVIFHRYRQFLESIDAKGIKPCAMPLRCRGHDSFKCTVDGEYMTFMRFADKGPRCALCFLLDLVPSRLVYRYRNSYMLFLKAYFENNDKDIEQSWNVGAHRDNHFSPETTIRELVQLGLAEQYNVEKHGRLYGTHAAISAKGYEFLKELLSP